MSSILPYIDDAHRSHEHLTAIINASPLPIYTIDLEGRVTTIWNRAAERVFGWSAEDVRGRFLPFVSEAHRDEFTALRDRALEGGGFSGVEITRTRRDGSSIELRLSTAPVRDAAGAVVGIMAVAEDITLRKRAQEALMRSEERHRMLFASHPLPLWIFDQKTLRFLDVNQAAIDAYGYTREEFLSMTILDIRPEEDGERLVDYMRTRDPEYGFGTVWRHRHRNGTVFSVEIFSRAIEFEGIPARFVLANDITERLDAEDAVRRLNDELERRVEDRTAELLAAVQDLESFSYTVSHDLRSPLRAINGFARILREEYGASLDAEALRLLDVIASNATMMGELINGLLAFARAGRVSLTTEPIDMNALVMSVIADARFAGDYTRTEIEVHPLPAAPGDTTLLRQVWSNLLDNALKFSATREQPRIVIDGEVRNGQPTYHVRDNGIGFENTWSHTMFDVFRRLHDGSAYDGTGIGLAIVHRIVTRHHGHVEAHGVPGEGAVFSFSLAPVEDAAA